MTDDILIPLDHDQRFKTLIRLFFPDFLRLFFPKYAACMDFSQLEWLNTELLPNPPDGDRHRLDMVAKLLVIEPDEPNAEPKTWLGLVHIEIEAEDRTTNIKPRLPNYILHLQNEYRLPVLPIVLYLDVSLDGIGIDRISQKFLDLEVSIYHFLYVGLPGLSGEEYIRGDSLIGVALSALMDLPAGRMIELAVEALLKLRDPEAPLTEQQRYLLCECVEAYLPAQAAELQRILSTVEKQMPRQGRPLQRNKTSYDRGREEGLEEGKCLSMLEMLEAQLDAKFGPLPSEALLLLRAKPYEELKALTIQLLQANTLAELAITPPPA